MGIDTAIYNRSCERMEELPDGSVDLIVTSPPYWVKPDDPLLAPALLRDGGGGTPQSYEELLTLLDRCFGECFRVLKPGGFCCVNVASSLVDGKLHPLPFALTLQMIGQGWTFREEILWRRWRGWDKRGGVPLSRQLLPQPRHRVRPGLLQARTAHRPGPDTRREGSQPGSG